MNAAAPRQLGADGVRARRFSAIELLAALVSLYSATICPPRSDEATIRRTEQ